MFILENKIIFRGFFLLLRGAWIDGDLHMLM